MLAAESVIEAMRQEIAFSEDSISLRALSQLRRYSSTDQKLRFIRNTSAKLPSLILATASEDDEAAPSGTGSPITSIEKPSFPDVVEILVIGPAIRNIMTVDIRRDVVPSVGEDDLAM